MMLDRLAEFEVERFEEEFADQNWYKGRQTKQIDAMEKARKRGKLSELSSLILQGDTDGSHYERPEKDILRGQGILAQASIQTLPHRPTYSRQQAFRTR